MGSPDRVGGYEPRVEHVQVRVQRWRVERPRPRARKERHQQQHANETRNATAHGREEEWDSADEALSCYSRFECVSTCILFSIAEAMPRRQTTITENSTQRMWVGPSSCPNAL